MINESLNRLILNTATAEPTIDWLFLIAGIVLLGISLLMYFKLRK